MAGVPNAVNFTRAQSNGTSGQTATGLHTNGDYAKTRDYRGKWISSSNVKNLQPAFANQTEVVDWRERAPVGADGGMYMATFCNQTHSIDTVTGKRTNDAGNMASVSKTLSDQDIEDLGHYLAGLY